MSPGEVVRQRVKNSKYRYIRGRTSENEHFERTAAGNEYSKESYFNRLNAGSVSKSVKAFAKHTNGNSYTASVILDKNGRSIQARHGSVTINHMQASALSNHKNLTLVSNSSANSGVSGHHLESFARLNQRTSGSVKRLVITPNNAQGTSAIKRAGSLKLQRNGDTANVTRVVTAQSNFNGTKFASAAVKQGVMGGSSAHKFLSNKRNQRKYGFTYTTM